VERIERLNRAGLDHMQNFVTIDNVEPDADLEERA